MLPARAIPSLLVSITVLAIVAWLSVIGWSSGSLYAHDVAQQQAASSR